MGFLIDSASPTADDDRPCLLRKLSEFELQPFERRPARAAMTDDRYYRRLEIPNGLAPIKQVVRAIRSPHKSRGVVGLAGLGPAHFVFFTPFEVEVVHDGAADAMAAPGGSTV